MVITIVYSQLLLVPMSYVYIIRNLPEDCSFPLPCRNTDEVLHYTQSTQYDPIDVFGCIRNSGVQTDLACVCSPDRLRNLSSRIALIERRLNLQDRSKNIPSNANVTEQLKLILRRLSIIENCLKRLRFDSKLSHGHLGALQTNEIRVKLTLK